MGLKSILGKIFGQAAPPARDFAVPADVLADIVAKIPMDDNVDFITNKTALLWNRMGKIVYNAHEKSPYISRENAASFGEACLEIAEAAEQQLPGRSVRIKPETIEALAALYSILDDLRSAYVQEITDFQNVVSIRKYPSVLMTNQQTLGGLRDGMETGYKKMRDFFSDHPGLARNYAERKIREQMDRQDWERTSVKYTGLNNDAVY